MFLRPRSPCDGCRSRGSPVATCARSWPAARLPTVARHRPRRPGLRPATAIMVGAGRANLGLAPILATAPGVHPPQRQKLAARTMKAVPLLVVAEVRLHQATIAVVHAGRGRLLAPVRRDVRLHPPGPTPRVALRRCDRLPRVGKRASSRAGSLTSACPRAASSSRPPTAPGCPSRKSDARRRSTKSEAGACISRCGCANARSDGSWRAASSFSLTTGARISASAARSRGVARPAEPHQAPAAPIIRHHIQHPLAAICRPVTIPPAASTGKVGGDPCPL